mgnify:CR=1 FL=1
MRSVEEHLQSVLAGVEPLSPLDVTLVDARHFEQHLKDLKEPSIQVGFADVVLLNKTDLTSDADLARIEALAREVEQGHVALQVESAKRIEQVERLQAEVEREKSM